MALTDTENEFTIGSLEDTAEDFAEAMAEDTDDGADGSADSCMPDTDGYTEYSWFYETRDDGDFRDLPAGDLRACDNGASGELNICEDNTADFLIQVKRNPSEVASCEPYRITVTNGE